MMHDPTNGDILHALLQLKAATEADSRRHDFQMDSLRSDMNRRFDRNDQRFDAMDARFDAMDQRFDAMDQRFDAMDARFDAMDQRFGHVESDVTEIRRTLRAKRPRSG